jgi:hypothetical protein
MLKNIVYEMKLVRVAGYPQPVPIVTGKRLDAGQSAAADVGGDGREAPEYGHAATIVEIMVRCFFPKEVRTEELNRQFQEETGLKRQTFYKGLNGALEKEWIVGPDGGPYNLNPNKCWMDIVQNPVQSTSPFRGAGQGGHVQMDNNWTSGQTESCKESDATGSSQKPNENNEAESSVDPSKMTDFEREMWEDLQGKNAGDNTKH